MEPRKGNRGCFPAATSVSAFYACACVSCFPCAPCVYCPCVNLITMGWKEKPGPFFIARFNALCSSVIQTKGSNPSQFYDLHRLQKTTSLPDLSSYYKWIDVLEVVEDNATLEKVIPDMRQDGIVVTIPVYLKLFTTLCKLNAFQSCETILNDMAKHKYHPEPTMYNTLLAKKSKSPDIQRCMDIISKMATDSSQLNAETIEIVQESSNLLHELRNKNLPPNTFTYNTILTQATSLEVALKLLEDMREHKVTPDIYTLNTLLEKATAISLPKSLEVLNLMKSFGVNPDYVTYNMLIQSRVKKDDKKGTLAFYEMMKQKKVDPTVVTFTELLYLARKLRDKPFYVYAVKELKESGLTLTTALRQLLEKPGDPKFWS